MSWPGVRGHQVKTHSGVVQTPADSDSRDSDAVAGPCRTSFEAIEPPFEVSVKPGPAQDIADSGVRHEY